MGLVLTIVLIAALVMWPDPSVHVLWDMVIPLLPAVFLINPVIWRNVCPLATLNALSGSRWARHRVMDRRWAAVSWAVGITLLVLLVPARRFLFNTNGLMLAITIAGVALLAIAAGFLVARRGAFCNGICPVLPVEKLYGQYPLLQVGTSRCATCSVCSPSACIELAQLKTVAQTLGPSRKDATWLATPFGSFAAAFPGFIIGYFTMENGAFELAFAVYMWVLIVCAVSYTVVALLVLLLRIPASTAMPALGAASIALYYWFAAPGLAAAYGGGDVATSAIRIFMVSLASFWLWRALTAKGDGFDERIRGRAAAA